MFREIYNKMPTVYRIKKGALSVDWQLYICCDKCLFEERYDPHCSIEDLNKYMANSTCSNCGTFGKKYFLPHKFYFVNVCNKCKSKFEIQSIELNNKCPHCFSTNIKIEKLTIFPPLPEKFKEADFPQKSAHIWGISPDDDAEMILRNYKNQNYMPDSNLLLLSHLRFAERLLMINQYGEKNVSELINTEGILLRNYYKGSGDLRAGLYAVSAYKKASELAESEHHKKWREHNIVMAIHSILTREPYERLKKHELSHYKHVALDIAYKILEYYTNEGKEIEISRVQISRLNHLIGSIHNLPPFDKNSIPYAFMHLKIAIDKGILNSYLKLDAANKLLAVYMRCKTLKMEVEDIISLDYITSSIEKYLDVKSASRIEPDSWLSLHNLSILYYDLGDLEKSKYYVEIAAAKILYELKVSATVNDIIIKLHKYSATLNHLAILFLELGEPNKAITIIEKFRGLNFTLKSKNKNEHIDSAWEFRRNYMLKTETIHSGHAEVEKIQIDNDVELKIETYLEKNPGKALSFIVVNDLKNEFYNVVYLKTGKLKTEVYKFQSDEIFKVLGKASSILRAGMIREMILKRISIELEKIYSNNIISNLIDVGIKTIGISQPSTFNLLPIELNLVQNQMKKEFNGIHPFNFSTVELLSQTTYNKAIKPSFKKILVISYHGSDLKFVQKEEDYLMETFSSNCKVLKSLTNKKELVEELEKDYDIIHISCHGYFNLDNPLNSFLVINPAIGESGILSAMEIQKIKFMNKPLVVLSACSSGLTSFDNFNSYMGLSGSLMDAGASGVLASRWNVFDEIAYKTVKLFYDYLEINYSPVEALNSAKHDMAETESLSDWASFTYFSNS